MNAPERSDVIVVMDGMWAKAVHLRKQGYGSLILIDADVTGRIYGKTEAELAADFLQRSRLSGAVICPTASGTKYDEAKYVQNCLAPLQPRSVLIVNTDFDTRRSLSIFRKRLPQYRWSIAASSAPFHDADQYWKHREWAKTVLISWEGYLTWKVVEQWRPDVVLR